MKFFQLFFAVLFCSIVFLEPVSATVAYATTMEQTVTITPKTALKEKVSLVKSKLSKFKSKVLAKVAPYLISETSPTFFLLVGLGLLVVGIILIFLGAVASASGSIILFSVLGYIVWVLGIVSLSIWLLKLLEAIKAKIQA